MKGRMWPVALLVMLPLMVLSCAGPYAASKRDIFEGKQLLAVGEYAGAQQEFVRAIEAQKSAWAYALAATASYKLNDLPDAQYYIDEALKMDGRSNAYLRILAYRALILLTEGREQEGIEALRQYLDTYRNYYPIPHRREIERMVNSGVVDLARLEVLLDDGISRYESDVDQWVGTGTGYLAERYGPPTVLGVP